jgi:hypothetical protein
MIVYQKKNDMFNVWEILMGKGLASLFNGMNFELNPHPYSTIV